MKIQLLCIIGLLIASTIQGQELVPNGSFEDNTDCPTGLSSSGYFSFVSGADTTHDFIRLAEPWYCPTSGTSDYLNICSESNMVAVPDNNWGSAEASDGNAYTALILYQNIADDWENAPLTFDYMEYIQAPLTEPLIPGGQYRASFKIRLAQNSRFAIDQVGLAIHEGPIVAEDSIYADRLDLTPTVSTPEGSLLTSTNEWLSFEAEFVASNSADHLTIGRFPKWDEIMVFERIQQVVPVSMRRAIYYIDEVSISFLGFPHSMEDPSGSDFKAFIRGAELVIENSEAAYFELYSIGGKKLMYIPQAGSGNRVDLGHLSSGYYILRSSDGLSRKLLLH